MSHIGLALQSPRRNAATEIAGIYSHNLLIAIVLLGGALWMRYLPHFIVLLNAVADGLLLSIVSRWTGVGQMLKVIVPHGVFEIPAFLLAGALGIGIGTWRRHSDEEPIGRSRLKQWARWFWLVALLLLVAASIEGTRISLASGPLLQPPRTPLSEPADPPWTPIQDPGRFGQPGASGAPISLKSGSGGGNWANLEGVQGRIVGFSARLRLDPKSNGTAGLQFASTGRMAYVSPGSGWFTVARLDQGRWAIEEQTRWEPGAEVTLTLLVVGKEMVFGVDGFEAIRMPTGLTELNEVGLGVGGIQVEFSEIRLKEIRR